MLKYVLEVPQKDGPMNLVHIPNDSPCPFRKFRDTIVHGANVRIASNNYNKPIKLHRNISFNLSNSTKISNSMHRKNLFQHDIRL